MGATGVGSPQFVYGRSHYASWGVTPGNHDAADVFVEEVDEEKGTYFDVMTKQFEKFETVEETIKVRFGSDVKIRHRFTRNGVILPENLLDGTGSFTMPYLPREAHQKPGKGKAYSLAWLLDPVAQEKMGVKLNAQSNTAMQRQFAIEHTMTENGVNFREGLKKWNPFGQNIMFIMLNGDIGF